MHAQPPCKQPVSHDLAVPKSVPIPSLCTRKGVCPSPCALQQTQALFALTGIHRPQLAIR